MECWFCYWGWPEEISRIYAKAVRNIDAILDLYPCEENDWTSWPGQPDCGEYGLQFGPGHIVWSDENWDSAEWCLKESFNPVYADWHPQCMEVLRRSLTELMAVPDSLKHPPSDYDGEHPEKFPPPANIKMVKLKH